MLILTGNWVRTRLFLIQLMRSEFFFLSIAADIDSDAPLSTNNAKLYQRTDAGILQMYTDLSASGIFPAVTHCYVPGNVNLATSLAQQLAGKLIGYDPATGLRRILLGSAIAQVVPIGDFATTNNQQIYDPTPSIVPLATSLVYDVTTNNAIAKAFVLPMAYVARSGDARDNSPSTVSPRTPDTSAGRAIARVRLRRNSDLCGRSGL